MASVGVDIIEIKRIGSAVNRGGERFLKRVYTETELSACRDRLSPLASRFAAKEAVMKVLGAGGIGIAWREIEVLTGDDGRPSVRLRGRALDKATKLNLKEVSVSLSDSKEYAVAVAVGI